MADGRLFRAMVARSRAPVRGDPTRSGSKLPPPGAARCRNVKDRNGDSEAMLRRFYAIQLETRRRLAVPPQPLRFFAIVREVFAQDHAIEVWLASSEGATRLPSFCCAKAPDYMRSGRRARRRAPPAPRTFCFTTCWSITRARRRNSTLAAPMRATSGLARFKAEMGAVVRAAPLQLLSSHAAPHQRRGSGAFHQRAGAHLAPAAAAGHARDRRDRVPLPRMRRHLRIGLRRGVCRLNRRLAFRALLSDTIVSVGRTPRHYP